MIGILGGMGTQAGLDFCNKLAMLNRGKLDQQYPMFVLYNKSNTPKRPENLKKYYNVLKELVEGCKLLERNKCKFIVIQLGQTAALSLARRGVCAPLLYRRRAACTRLFCF